MLTVIKKLPLFFLICLFCFNIFSAPVFARANINDWYVQECKIDIVVNKDSSVLITERIIADCGLLPNKHGIFRVLPYEIKTDHGVIRMPVKLISITDFNGQPHHYQVISDPLNKTLTWKIGDPNKTVTGINNYQIVYKISNVIRFAHPDFDEFYFNILGIFWELEVDNASAKIIFPPEITKDNAQIYLYSGVQGEKTNLLSDYYWQGDGSLFVYAKTPLLKNQGITLSAALPKNIFQKPAFSEMFDKTLLLWLIPVIVFIIGFQTWKKYGQDPHYAKKTITPEYEAPYQLTPLESFMMLHDFRLGTKAITATLIYFAAKGLVTIKERKMSFLHGRTFIFRKIKDPIDSLAGLEAELYLFNAIFPDDRQERDTVSFGRDFSSKKRAAIEKASFQDLANRDLVSQKSLLLRKQFMMAADLMFVAWFFSLLILWRFCTIVNVLAPVLAVIILHIFGKILPKATPTGQEAIWRLKGFKLYLETAEKYRQQFHEKENIFEKFLPYAIAFNMTKLWINKMKQIYGEKHMNNYVPVWYVPSAGSKAQMDFDSFSASLNSVSSAISAFMGGASGFGGSGSSGGGGGGGGGGGW